MNFHHHPLNTPLRLRLHQEPTALEGERDNQRTTDMADLLVLVDLCGSGRLQDLLLIVERYGSPQVMKWLDRMGAMQSGTGL